MVEVAYLFTLESNDESENILCDLLEGYLATLEGQYKILKTILETIAAVPERPGHGLF